MNVVSVVFLTCVRRVWDVCFFPITVSSRENPVWSCEESVLLLWQLFCDRRRSDDVVCVLLFFSFIGLSLPVVSGASICSFLIHRSFVGVDDDRFRDISRHLFNKTKFQKFKMALSFISILEHHLRFNQSRSLSLASHLATTRRNAMHFLQTATAHTFSLLILLRCCIN